MGDAKDYYELSLELEGILGVHPLVRVYKGKKKPVGYSWGRGPRDDPDRWRAKLRGLTSDGDFNLGILAGEGPDPTNSLVLVDLDTYRPEGPETLRIFEDLGWAPANTVRVRSGGGGLHVCGRYDATRWDIGNGNLKDIVLPDGSRCPAGGEYKGTGGCGVIPPSWHESGHQYVYEADCSPWDSPLWLPGDDLLGALGSRRSNGPSPSDDVGDVSGEVDAATAAAVEILIKHFGAHHPEVAHAADGRAYVLLTRPGKDASDGSSVTVGYGGPGLMKVFSSNFPPFTAEGLYDLGLLRQMAGVAGPKIRVPGASKSVFSTGRSVRSEQLTWLWKDHIPAGQMVIGAGQEKLGKSTAFIWVAARLTKGDLPGDFESNPVDVAFVSAEDDPEHILKPRAVAADVDLDRIWFLSSRGPGFSLAAVRELGPTLVVLDPLSVFIHLNMSNEHGEVNVRQALEPFNALAQDYGITVVGVRHVRKSPAGDNPYDAILGSRAWSAAARAVLFFTPDPEHRDRPGGLIFPRGNLARPGVGSRYRLDSERVLLDDGNFGDYPLFVLEEGGAGINLDEALGPREEVAGRLKAEQFLRKIFAGGEKLLASDVLRAAEDEDIAERTLRRAKTDLGVLSERVGFGKGSTVFWWLPPIDGQEPS